MKKGWKIFARLGSKNYGNLTWALIFNDLFFKQEKGEQQCYIFMGISRTTCKHNIGWCMCVRFVWMVNIEYNTTDRCKCLNNSNNDNAEQKAG